MALPISNSQSQTTTQSPQSSVQAPASGGQTSNLQPNATNGLNSGPGSVTLHPTDLTTLNLNSTSQTSTSIQTAKPVPTKPHHTNGIFLGLAVLLIAVAAIMIWTTNRASKDRLTKNR